MLRHQAFRQFLEDLRSLGVRDVSTERRGEGFLIVGARSNARWWLLPLKSRRGAAMGLEMLQPVTTVALAVKSVAKVVARFGPRSLLRFRALYLSGTPDIGTSFGGRAETFAYFTGTSGPHRKTTIQVMDGDGDILGYAKYSQNPSVCNFIKREAKALDEIAALNLKTVAIPEVLCAQFAVGSGLLVSDTVKRGGASSPKRLIAKHIAFLKEIQARSRKVGAQGLYARLAADLSKMEPSLSEEWVERFGCAMSLLEGKISSMPVSYAHGDFTPWNCFELEDRLYLFDWEYAESQYPLGYDHLHFLLATAPTMHATAAMQWCEKELAETWFGGDIQSARLTMLMCLVVHAIFYFQRSIPTNAPSSGFEGERMRAEMIDLLLERVQR